MNTSKYFRNIGTSIVKVSRSVSDLSTKKVSDESQKDSLFAYNRL